MAQIKSVDDFIDIIQYTPLEKGDDHEKTWKDLYCKLFNEIQDKSDSEIESILSTETSNTNNHANIVIGLLYGMMIDQQQSQRYFQILNSITRDRYSLCVSQLKKLICEKFHRLQPFAQDQIIWIVSELINHSATESSVLVQYLLKHIITGNTSTRNITLIQQLLNLCIQYKDWLYEQSSLIPIVWYTFMSLIYDHGSSQFDSIREKEITLCTQIIRERFDSVKIIGRDLIRVLFNVSKIPQFESVWNDIILAPCQSSDVNSNISNLRALVHIPTPKHILASRLTPEMETWLLFMMKEVKIMNVKRYQTWFAAKFFPNGLSQSLTPDLIRYICGVWHPPNHILSSDITPRYAQIGWILTAVSAPMWKLFCTQALLYDWFFFVRGKDGIMNIEPAILLMINSLKRHPDLTELCVEQIVAGMNPLIAIDQNIKDDIRNGIQASVKILLEKKVVLSIEPICNFQRLKQHIRDELRSLMEPFLNHDHGSHKSNHLFKSELKEMPHSKVDIQVAQVKQTKSLIDELFPDVSKKVQKTKEDPTQNKVKSENILPQNKANELSPRKESPQTVSEEGDEDVFSGWSDKVANIASEINQSSGTTKIVKDVILTPRDPVHISDNNTTISNYKEVLATIGKLIDDGNVTSSKASFESFLKCLSSGKSIESIDTNDIGRLIIETFIDEFKETNPKSFFENDELIHSRIFDVYNKGRSPLIKKILWNMRDIESSIGFRFLCHTAGKENLGSDDKIINSLLGDQMDLADEDDFDENDRLIVNLQSFINLHDRQIEKDKKNNIIFRDYLDFIQTNSVKKSQWKKIFLEDCLLCAQANISLFMELTPYLFRYFSENTVGNIKFIKLVTDFVYPEKLLSMECQVSVSDYSIFGNSINMDELLIESLEWESFSQISLWRLISAEFVSEHDVLMKSILPFLKKLDHIKHSEAIIGITSIILSRPPNPITVETLLSLPLRLSRFVCTILTRWARTELKSLPKKEDSNALRKYVIWSDFLSKSMTEALQSLSNRKKPLIRNAIAHLALLRSVIREEAIDFFISYEKLTSKIVQLITQNQLESEFEDLYNVLSEYLMEEDHE